MGFNLFSSLGALSGYTGWIVPFLFTLTVLVFFHELGHFYRASQWHQGAGVLDWFWN
jgi:hypothetical protein